MISVLSHLQGDLSVLIFLSKLFSYYASNTMSKQSSCGAENAELSTRQPGKRSALKSMQTSAIEAAIACSQWHVVSAFDKFLSFENTHLKEGLSY